MAEIRRYIEGNEIWCTSYQQLDENLGGVVGNGELTSESCGTAENNIVESGNRDGDDEMVHGRAPQLHKEENVR
jgi:hypothetical protein